MHRTVLEVGLYFPKWGSASASSVETNSSFSIGALSAQQSYGECARHAFSIFIMSLVAFGDHTPWHNAFGESIGRCLPEEHPPLGCGVTLSGRVSFELVAEWARPGIELISAAPAPF